MNDSDLFSYDRFLSLTGPELASYAEQFVNIQMQAIPASVYDPLQSTLGQMDEAHIVYALEICMVLKPHEFLNRAVTFLSHKDASVSCAAYRVISKLPPNSIPDELKRTIAATPVVDIFAPDLRSSSKIRVGTNEEFIRNLVAKFA